MSKRVLLIEDDIEISNFIAEYLNDFDFSSFCAYSAKEALSELEKNPKYDIIILDLMLPDIDGFDLFKKIKKIVNIPIIISSARGDIGNKILGFELGADDYLAKPYEPRELVLRIEHCLKKTSKEQLDIGLFRININNRELVVDDYSVDLTKIEFEIFVFLVQNCNKNVSREQIVHATSLDEFTKNRTIDTHISNIRYKIGDDSKNPKYIKSIWGIGYKFVS